MILKKYPYVHVGTLVSIRVTDILVFCREAAFENKKKKHYEIDLSKEVNMIITD